MSGPNSSDIFFFFLVNLSLPFAHEEHSMRLSGLDAKNTAPHTAITFQKNVPSVHVLLRDPVSKLSFDNFAQVYNVYNNHNEAYALTN